MTNNYTALLAGPLDGTSMENVQRACQWILDWSDSDRLTILLSDERGTADDICFQFENIEIDTGRDIRIYREETDWFSEEGRNHDAPRERNQRLIERNPNVVVAFFNRNGSNRTPHDTVQRAVKAGIRTFRVWDNGRVEHVR